MKRWSFVFCMVFGLPLSLLSYDNSPSNYLVIPEVIWAPATGGGTWVTELQITDLTGDSIVVAYFNYGTGYRSVTLWTSPGIYRSVKFTNILQTMQSLDPSFNYYGKVGALDLITQGSSYKIQAQARTVNGNYGKTFPGLALVGSNTANVGRDMMIQGLTQNSTYRTFVGFYNCTNASMTVEFRIINQNNQLVGSVFTKTFGAYGFQAFNPFVEAGVGTGTYDNCWLHIHVTSGNGSSSNGLFCFGSSANNYTNDTAAYIAVQFQ